MTIFYIPIYKKVDFRDVGKSTMYYQFFRKLLSSYTMLKKR